MKISIDLNTQEEIREEVEVKEYRGGTRIFDSGKSETFIKGEKPTNVGKVTMSQEDLEEMKTNKRGFADRNPKDNRKVVK